MDLVIYDLIKTDYGWDYRTLATVNKRMAIEAGYLRDLALCPLGPQTFLESYRYPKISRFVHLPRGYYIDVFSLVAKYLCCPYSERNVKALVLCNKALATSPLRVRVGRPHFSLPMRTRADYVAMEIVLGCGRTLYGWRTTDSMKKYDIIYPLRHELLYIIMSAKVERIAYEAVHNIQWIFAYYINNHGPLGNALQGDYRCPYYVNKYTTEVFKKTLDGLRQLHPKEFDEFAKTIGIIDHYADDCAIIKYTKLAWNHYYKSYLTITTFGS